MNTRPILSALLAAAGLALSASFVMAEPPADAKPVPATKTEPKQDETKVLKVGDKAPAITVGKFIKGSPVTGFEKGQVYVVEFWATWCGPCKVSIPHLTELAHRTKDKGVKVIGVSVWEKDQAAIEPFVQAMGDKMDYIVATDDVPALPADVKPGTREAQGFFSKNGKMSQGWMAAAKRGGIPSAFVVNKEGTIVWIGNPLSFIDGVVDKVVAGTFDPAKQADHEKKVGSLQRQLSEALNSGDFDAGFKAIDEVVAMEPALAARMVPVKFHALLSGKKDYTAAYALANSLADGMFKNDAQVLNEIAWTILDGEGIENRDLNTAMRIAQRAVDVSKGQDGMILDTLARAHWEKGDKAKALELQTKAVALVKDADMKKEMESTLAKYKSESNKK